LTFTNLLFELIVKYIAGDEGPPRVSLIVTCWRRYGDKGSQDPSTMSLLFTDTAVCGITPLSLIISLRYMLYTSR
jgi:hypothetical protein